MKKIITTFLCYTLFVAAIFFCVGFFQTPVDDIPQNFAMPLKISEAFIKLFEVLPSICFTGFLLGCSLTFGDFASKAEKRFSTTVSALLKSTLFVAFLIALLISLCRIVYEPNQVAKQKSIKEIPSLVNEYVSLALKHLDTDSPENALKYLEQAIALDTKNERLAEMKNDTERLIKDFEIKKSEERSISYAQTNFNERARLPDNFDESKMSIDEMIERAQRHFEERDFFTAHYFAVNVMRLCEKNSKHYKVAEKLAEDSWEELERAQMEGDTEGMIFFRRKLAAYSALINGEIVDAYYGFRELSDEDVRKERDPDVIRYLELSQNRLLENYFFIDETSDLETFENASNIYFKIEKPQGGYDIVLIRGVTEIKGSGKKLVRYLRNLEIYSFDANSNLLSTMKTPYAKMTAIDVDTLDENVRWIYAGVNSAKIIPQLQLCSLDRAKNQGRQEPRYVFENNPNPSQSEMPQKIFWPIPYQDFTMITEAFAGHDNLNIFSIMRLARNSESYGFPHESFSFATLNKIFYPFMVLVFLIFTASIAWNYRLAPGVVFKFKWVFILPLFNFLFYLVSHFVEYIVRITSYVFIAVAGADMAFLAGIVFYIFLLGAVITIFLSRKGD